MTPEMQGQEEEVPTGNDLTIPTASYPDLKAAEEGQKVTILGTIKSNDGENVIIAYDSVKVEQNMADKSMQKMTGKKTAVKDAMPVGEEEDDY